MLVLVVLLFALTDAEQRAWGWRIPFVMDALAAVIALMLRRSLEETFSAADRANQDAGTLSNLFKHHQAAFFTVPGDTAGGLLIFYTFTTYMQKYLVNSAGMSVKTASLIMTCALFVYRLTMTCALFVYRLMQPLFGMLSDRIGRRTSILWFGGLGTLCTLPILLTLHSVTNPVMAFVLIISALAIVSF